jgi:hypothetical protein
MAPDFVLAIRLAALGAPRRRQAGGMQQPVVKGSLHSPGDASRRSALLVGRIFPIFLLLAA